MISQRNLPSTFITGSARNVEHNLIFQNVEYVCTARLFSVYVDYFINIGYCSGGAKFR